jgi:hypothetical protein
MAKMKYDKYIIKEPFAKSIFKEVVAPQFYISGARNCNGANFSLGWSFLTEPFLMVGEAHKHDFDQIICFLGGNPMNIKDFDAEVELYLGEEKEKYIIDSSSFVYVPKGMMHCPLNVKRVTKPIMFIDVVLAPEPDVRRKPASK